MSIYTQPDIHFTPGQFLLADSAYGLSSTCIPSYKIPAANDPFNSLFNTYLAKSRVRNEHCIGILKSRWGSLQGLRNQIRNQDEMFWLCKWAVACFILHKMLAQLGDAWDDLHRDDDDNEDGEDDDLYEIVNNDVHAFREQVKRTALDIYGIQY